MSESESSLPALRASDAERERAADVLREAMTSGRLGIDELDDRMRRVLGAQTRVDLEQLVADVIVPADDRHPLAAAGVGPGARTERVPVRAGGNSTHRIVAVLGGSERKGRWRLATDCSVTCVLGGVELDLTQVELAGDSVELSIFCLLGGAGVTLPPHLNVRAQIPPSSAATTSTSSTRLRIPAARSSTSSSHQFSAGPRSSAHSRPRPARMTRSSRGADPSPVVRVAGQRVAAASPRRSRSPARTSRSMPPVPPLW